MILIKDPIFCDPNSDIVMPVIELTQGSTNVKFDKKHFYLIDDTLYRYVGDGSINEVIPGTIFRIGHKYYVEPHTIEMQEFYNEKFIVSKEEYDNRINSNQSIEEMAIEYMSNYKVKNNLVVSGNIKIIPSGEIYFPELDPDDDPLERVTKLMLRHMKLILNDFRGHFKKKHGLDNIKSALNGATNNMSIIKFMSWCDTVGLDWEITLDNLHPGVDHPLPRPIVLTNDKEYPWIDVQKESKDCFTVPLTEGEDPLKRGIKLVLGVKQIDIKEYRHKSPTPHLLNNMKSALKSKQKMTLPYALNWGEILDVSISFKLINPKDGVWYKLTGYDMTTNDTEID